MIVSWNWLKQYVTLDMPLEQLQRRLTMAGLNHEETREVGGDLAIDLEVTSNRPDCLGHLGVAREVAVLFGRELHVPQARPPEGDTPVEKLVEVQIDCPDLCPRYTARVIRGVKVGPSPRWLVRRLQTVGLTPINNVVDISNYVLMECGQPLHTFDYAKLKGPRIVVRRPRPGESIEAIDHRIYDLSPQMCVIADAEDPVAIGGVMGGAATEISAETTDVLVEAAEFNPVSIRNTARALNLHSDSSYRFERGVDPMGVDWASRRCCELILELAGGELARGVVDVGRRPPQPQLITLRLSQIERILGIEIPLERVREILLALGLREVEDGARGREGKESASATLTLLPPSWRRDLTREIDLVEEVGRIHGYDAIPEDVGVPMVASRRPERDRVIERIRTVLLSHDLERGGREDIGRLQSLERCRAVAPGQSRAARGRPPAAQFGAQSAAGPASQRGTVESRDRTVRDCQGLFAAAGPTARRWSASATISKCVGWWRPSSKRSIRSWSRPPNRSIWNCSTRRRPAGCCWTTGRWPAWARCVPKRSNDSTCAGRPQWPKCGSSCSSRPPGWCDASCVRPPIRP